MIINSWIKFYFIGLILEILNYLTIFCKLWCIILWFRILYLELRLLTANAIRFVIEFLQLQPSIQAYNLLILAEIEAYADFGPIVLTIFGH